jgi:hypothetical protein
VTLAYRAVYYCPEFTIEELLPGDCQVRAPFREHCLPYPPLFEGILVASFSDLEIGHRSVQFGACDEVPFQKPNRALMRLTRLSEHGACLAHQWRALEVNAIIHTFRGEAEACPGLLQCCLRLLHAQAEVGRIEPCNDLSLADTATEIDRDLTQPASDLETQHYLIFGGQRASDDGSTGHRILSSRDYTDLPWWDSGTLGFLRGSCGGMIAVTTDEETQGNDG